MPLIDNLVNVARFMMAIILAGIAMRAFLRTRSPAMFYITFGFTLMSVGNIFSAIYYLDNARMNDLLSDSFDILGMVALMVALKKG